MSKNRLSCSILVLAVVSIVFGCASMKEPPKTEKTWIEEIEELAGGQVLAIDWSTYYPIGSQIQRYYVFILKDEIPELKAFDISFNDMYVIKRIKLVDIDESNITRYNQARQIPIKMTKEGSPGWTGGSCLGNCLAMCVDIWGFSGAFDECFSRCVDSACKRIPDLEPIPRGRSN
jgi:hypothetical protein